VADSRRITLTRGTGVLEGIIPPVPELSVNIRVRAKVVGAYLLCAIVWGTTWFAIRVSIAPGGFPTYEAAALRFSVAVAIIAPLGLAGLPRLKQQLGTQLWWLCAAGLINAAGYGLVYKGEESVPGSVAAVLFGSLPLVTAICAAATRTEPVSPGQVGGALIALGGITTIFWDRLGISVHQAVGVVLVFGAVVANAAYLLVFKRKARDAHSITATGVFLAATCAGLWLFSLTRGWQPLPWPLPVRPALAILYLSAVGSVVAFVCYLYLVKHVSVMTVSTLVIVEPVIALVVDRIWEHGVRFTRLTYAGAAITLAGLLISLLLKPTHVQS
jgi:drug/metabolite transporter (DMT)-like permease